VPSVSGPDAGTDHAVPARVALRVWTVVAPCWTSTLTVAASPAASPAKPLKVGVARLLELESAGVVTATGLSAEVTVIGTVVVPWAPPLSVNVKVAMKGPATEYVWLGLASVELPPSPKFQLYAVMVPSLSVDPAEEKATVRGAGPDGGVPVATATGDWLVGVDPDGAHPETASANAPRTVTATNRVRDMSLPQHRPGAMSPTPELKGLAGSGVLGKKFVARSRAKNATMNQIRIPLASVAWWNGTGPSRRCCVVTAPVGRGVLWGQGVQVAPSNLVQS